MYYPPGQLDDQTPRETQPDQTRPDPFHSNNSSIRSSPSPNGLYSTLLLFPSRLLSSLLLLFLLLFFFLQALTPRCPPSSVPSN